MRRLALLSALILSACDDDALRAVEGEVRVLPSQLDFGRVLQGLAVERTLEVTNSSKGELDVAFDVTGSAFALVDPPARLPLGNVAVRVRFLPTSEGAFDGLVTVTVPGVDALHVPMSGEGAPIPECRPTRACHASAWSLTEGRCVETPLADGAACEAACLSGAHCEAGRCVGVPISCDDGNACTVDTCAPERGCEHSTPVSCPGAGPCQVGVCDPAVGCGLAPAEDGTPCGPRRACNGADVCLGGACVLRDPPDNFLCADESPCQGEGRCLGDLCVRPPPTTLQPAWTVGAAQLDGGPPDAWSDLLVEPDGRVTLSSYFMSPALLDARSPTPVRLPSGSARRCIRWRGMLACADYPTSPAVSLIDDTGAVAWTYTSISADLPEYAGPTVQVFLARLMALSDQQLVALFESRTPNPDGSDPRCRRFALVVLDAQGRAVTARRIEHPIFEVCTHPHPYGAAVDAAGNVYLAFTPSGGDNPARALSDTLLLSYSAVLQPRWVHQVTGLPGGELAVAGPWLLHERTASAFATSTGASSAAIAVPFLGGVATRDLLIPAPADGTIRLEAFAAANLATTWQRQTSGTPWFSGAPLALAQLSTPRGPRPVVLAFDFDGRTHAVGGTDVETGAELFHCPLPLAGPPVHVAPIAGALVLGSDPRGLGGGPACADCDPRYAETRVTFQWYPMPGLLPGVGRWVGTNGGPTHDHREEPVP